MRLNFLYNAMLFIIVH